MEIRVIRSKKRRKTVEARQKGEVFEVLAPAHMSDKDLEPIIDNFKKRMNRQKAQSTLDDEALARRAMRLNHQYFDNRLKWESIRWVTNQNKRHGSCTTHRGTIRISHHLAKTPGFVQDYVVMHELAHLIEPNHGRRFWELVYRYPKTERARGFLMALGLEDKEAL